MIRLVFDIRLGSNVMRLGDIRLGKMKKAWQGSPGCLYLGPKGSGKGTELGREPRTARGWGVQGLLPGA